MKKTLTSFAMVAALFAGQASAKELKMATIHTENSVWGEMISGYLAKVSELSNGELTIVPYWGAQLGNQQETLNMMLRGRVDIWNGPASSFGVLSEESTILGLPYVFENEEHMVCVVKRVENSLASLIEPRGHLLSLQPSGWIDLPSKVELHSPEDVRGMKVRTGAQDIAIGFWQEVGAEPVPLTVAELNQALATNLVKAGENVLHYYEAISTYSVAPFYVETNHYYNIGAFVVAKSTWNSLSDAEKQALEDAKSDFAFDNQVEKLMASAGQVKSKLSENGVTFIALTEEEKVKFRKIGLASHAKLTAGLGESSLTFYKEVLAASAACNP